jgi:hypothetical protein
VTDAGFLQPPPAELEAEIPPDRLPCPKCLGRNRRCPRCNRLGHLAPAEIRGVRQGSVWDMEVDPPIQRACGQPIDDHEWRKGERRCMECIRQRARLAELRGVARILAHLPRHLCYVEPFGKPHGLWPTCARWHQTFTGGSPQGLAAGRPVSRLARRLQVTLWQVRRRERQPVSGEPSPQLGVASAQLVVIIKVPVLASRTGSQAA